MDPDALRDGIVIVNLRLADGGDLPFLVDTGSPGTLFDRTLMSKLGWRLPIGSVAVRMAGEPEGKAQKSGVYLEPALYLAGTKLKTGHLCASYDFKPKSTNAGHPLMGILAMDCLKHYCIQFDFEAREMRFLDDRRLDVSQLGRAYPLSVFPFYGVLFTKHPGLAGGKNGRLLIDTGDNSDGQIDPSLSSAVVSNGWNHLAQCVWDGKSYTDLDVDTGINSIGLRFLARHLVTFDFPNRTMHLKQTDIGPPMLDEEYNSAFAFIKGLNEAGRQPGWLKGDHGTLEVEKHPDPGTFVFAVRKKGDASLYHYTVTRVSKDTPWKMQRAWRTDKDGATMEEFALP